MSRVDVFKCDQCGKQSANTKEWIHLHATCNGQTARHFQDYVHGQGSMLHVSSHSPTVNVTGKWSAQLSPLDLCSPQCAGEYLFGQPHTEAGT